MIDFILPRFDLDDIEGGIWVVNGDSFVPWVEVSDELLLSWEFLLSLVKIVNYLISTIGVLNFSFKLRNIWTLGSCILVTSLCLYIPRLYHLIIFFLCRPLTTLSISFSLSLPPGIPWGLIRRIHALFSSVLLKDEWICDGSLQVVSFFPGLIEF